MQFWQSFGKYYNVEWQEKINKVDHENGKLVCQCEPTGDLALHKH